MPCGVRQLAAAFFPPKLASARRSAFGQKLSLMFKQRLDARLGTDTMKSSCAAPHVDVLSDFHWVAKVVSRVQVSDLRMTEIRRRRLLRSADGRSDRSEIGVVLPRALATGEEKVPAAVAANRDNPGLKKRCNPLERWHITKVNRDKNASSASPPFRPKPARSRSSRRRESTQASPVTIHHSRVTRLLASIACATFRPRAHLLQFPRIFRVRIGLP
jgi:hypothetical protein